MAPGQAPIQEQHDPTEDLARPALAEGLSSRTFHTALLKNPQISEIGETVETEYGPGRLIRIPLLEGITWNAPVEHVLPNPKQPRTYFDEEKMAELASTIGSVGQDTPISVIPVQFENGEIKFFILDGERRFRVMSQTLGFDNVDVTVKFVKNFWLLFAKSFIANESRAPQNPIERARTYKYLLENIDPELGRKRTTEELAEYLGTTASDILTHLELLDLPESVQRKIIDGTLSKSNVLSLKQAQKALGNDLEATQLARAILRKLYGDDEGRSKDPKKIVVTKRDVQRATQEALRGAGQSAIAEDLEAKRVTAGIKSKVHAAQNIAEELLAANPAQVVEVLRNKSTPPEAILDAIRIAIAALTASLEIIKLATKEDPLPEVANKPSFTAKITASLNNIYNQNHLVIAKILAQESDSTQEALSSEQLAALTNMTTMEIGANIRHMQESIKSLGLKIETYQGRALDSHGIYKKVTTYRLEWDLPADEEKPLKTAAKTALIKATQAAAIETKLATLTALGVDPRRAGKGSAVQAITSDSIPALEIPEDKPDFARHVEGNQNAFKNSLRKKLATALAMEAVTSQRPLSATQIAAALGYKDTQISNNIRHLSEELASIGLELKIFEIIKQDQNGKDFRSTAYRLAWPKDTPEKGEETPATNETIASLLEQLRAANEESQKDKAIINKLQAEVAGLKNPAQKENPSNPLEIVTLNRRIAELEEALNRQRTIYARIQRERDDLRNEKPKLEGKIATLAREIERLKRRSTNQPQTKTVKVPEGEKSILTIIEENEAEFGNDDLAFEIAKILAEPDEDGSVAKMTSDDILAYLKEDPIYKVLTTAKVGTKIKQTRVITERLGIQIMTEKPNNAATMFWLEKEATTAITANTKELQQLEANKTATAELEATIAEQQTIITSLQAEVADLTELLNESTSSTPAPAEKPAAPAPAAKAAPTPAPKAKVEKAKTPVDKIRTYHNRDAAPLIELTQQAILFAAATNQGQITKAEIRNIRNALTRNPLITKNSEAHDIRPLLVNALSELNSQNGTEDAINLFTEALERLK